MLVTDVHEAPIAPLVVLGYKSVGFRLQDKSFDYNAANTHVIQPDDGKAKARYWDRHQYDLSFWLTRPDHDKEVPHCFDDSTFVSALKNAFGELRGVSISVMRFDEYFSTKTHQFSRSYRVNAEASGSALSRERMIRICDQCIQTGVERGLWFGGK